MNSVCRNCQESDWKLDFQASDFDTATELYWLAECAFCGVTATLGVDDDTLESAYSADYYGSGRLKFSGLLEHILSALSRRNARQILDQWSRTSGQNRTPTVLDLGCGRGVLLRAFKSLGAQVLGLEREQFPLEPGTEDFIRIGSLDDAQYTERRFDIIILWHVLEHIAEVDEVLNSISRHMNENGLLVVAVPNFYSVQKRLFGKHWFHLDIPRHLYHFNTGWLSARLHERGFKDLSITTFDLTQNIYGFVQSSLNKLFPGRPNELYNLLKYGTNNLQLPKLIPWLCLTLVIFPFALLELSYSALTGQGASLIIQARSSS